MAHGNDHYVWVTWYVHGDGDSAIIGVYEDEADAELVASEYRDEPDVIYVEQVRFHPRGDRSYETSEVHDTEVVTVDVHVAEPSAED